MSQGLIAQTPTPLLWQGKKMTDYTSLLCAHDEYRDKGAEVPGCDVV